MKCDWKIMVFFVAFRPMMRARWRVVLVRYQTAKTSGGMGRRWDYNTRLHIWRFSWLKKKNMAAGNHSFYNGLLGLAETFRTSNPPKIRQCIQCLQSVFHFQPSVAMQACTNLQLGKLLFVHTKNIDLARSHLEKSVSLSFEWF